MSLFEYSKTTFESLIFTTYMSNMENTYIDMFLGWTHQNLTFWFVKNTCLNILFVDDKLIYTHQFKLSKSPIHHHNFIKIYKVYLLQNHDGWTWFWQTHNTKISIMHQFFFFMKCTRYTLNCFFFFF